MIEVRKSNERGHANHGWLDTYHTFSFNTYHDPRYMGFRALRVINEDRVAPGVGFPKHPHRDMEILTYVIDGELQHKDSMGNGEVIRPGEIQRMSAGSGIMHSEFNASKDNPVHLLQIWIQPNERGIEPSYEQIEIGHDETPGALQLIASPEGGPSSVKIHQDTRLYRGELRKDATLTHTLAAGRYAYVQVVRGVVQVGGKLLEAGDGAAVSDTLNLEFKAATDTEFLVFDLG